MFTQSQDEAESTALAGVQTGMQNQENGRLAHSHPHLNMSEQLILELGPRNLFILRFEQMFLESWPNRPITIPFK